MTMISEEERKRLITLGSEGIMREIAEDKHCQSTSPYRDAVDALLASVKAAEDAAAFARAEAREEITLSIANKALRSSYWANAIAIIAVIIAVIAIALQK